MLRLEEVSRRGVLTAAAGAISANTFHRALAAQPEKGVRAIPADKAPKGSKQPEGAPVSETAAAQEGVPKVPGPPQRKVKFALVGLGKLTVGEIIPALRLSTRCEVSTLVTGDVEKGRAIARAMGLSTDRVRGYADIPSFKDDEDIEAVYIATPNGLHVRDAVPALKAGKHVLCEKPLTTTVKDAERMIEAASEAGRLLMTAYRVHHEPLNIRLKQMIKQKKYGSPHFVTFDAVLDVGGRKQWRLDQELAGGGSLFDIGIYALNTTCWLLGEEPVEISAMQRERGDDKRFEEVEESIAFMMRFPSGCVALCTSSFGTARVNRYKVICEKGWMGMEPATTYRGLEARHGDDESTTVLKEPESVNQFAAEFDHFARCIKDGETLESPGEEGLRDVGLMHEIYAAAADGRRRELR